MTLPVRRGTGSRPAERRFPGGAGDPLAEFDDLIEVDLPGVKRDDIDIEMSERELAISGEFKERERAGVMRRGTRRTGRFEFRTLLPGEVDAEGASATLADGVLTVNVPKVEAAKPRHIEITSGE
ncbi:Hsp20/alpha crystallin family protein [Streptomyces sp. PSKA30]|uniref:Hsp20/alpha crystallin family protein n=1 Tax=Streptomyces sp. PSKA30 TaxID=2874597 RepID=UPI001CD1032D|nr:Hsp20/alpha crystallin family protein [Streptomyces sp. PSKA30]MBZ9645101.1 Hsp20/alpha crystallin family protein [Streptomyces sp. PSKA30]